MENCTGQLVDTSQLAKLRRERARVLTVEREREGPPCRRLTRRERKRESEKRTAAARVGLMAPSEALPQALTVPASAFLRAKRVPAHVDLVDIDVPLRRLFASELWVGVRTLDASQLRAGDDFARELARCRSLKNLWWLDLAGNLDITRNGVEAIAHAVADARLPHLKWLNLLGTRCDATPYIDGSYWRMTRKAEELAREFGAQAWMMLGTRRPELSGREPLRPTARRLPPDRFMRA
jgi:hypothetical protein